MAVSEQELAAVKAYMRVDQDDLEDDEVIEALYEAARSYLTGAGISDPGEAAEGHSLYLLALWGLTLYYHDHRDAVGAEQAFPVGLRPVITQLKLAPRTAAAET